MLLCSPCAFTRLESTGLLTGASTSVSKITALLHLV